MTFFATVTNLGSSSPRYGSEGKVKIKTLFKVRNTALTANDLCLLSNDVVKNCTLTSTSVTGDVTIRHQNWNHAKQTYTRSHDLGSHLFYKHTHIFLKTALQQSFKAQLL
jgi:hypothetical protein